MEECQYDMFIRFFDDMHALIMWSTRTTESSPKQCTGTVTWPEGTEIPIIVVANKQDLPNALSPEKICDKMGLSQLLKDNPRQSSD